MCAGCLAGDIGLEDESSRGVFSQLSGEWLGVSPSSAFSGNAGTTRFASIKCRSQIVPCHGHVVRCHSRGVSPDRVQHDVLMNRVSRKVHDVRLLRLIGLFSIADKRGTQRSRR